MSAKSVFMGWGGAIAIVWGIGGLIATAVVASQPRPDLWTPLLLSVFAWGFFIFTKTYKGITRASYARACELGQLMGLNAQGMAEIAKAYDQPPPTFGFELLPGAPSARNFDLP